SESVAHSDLHSFPTRRSSDLNFYFRGANKTVDAEGSYVRSGIRLVTDGGEFDEVEATSDSPNNDLFSVYNTTFRKLVFSNPSPRSEEHTSELQSRENLVCRLL